MTVGELISELAVCSDPDALVMLYGGHHDSSEIIGVLDEGDVVRLDWRVVDELE